MLCFSNEAVFTLARLPSFSLTRPNIHLLYCICCMCICCMCFWDFSCTVCWGNQSPWYLYFKQKALEHSIPFIFKVNPPFSDRSVPRCSRQAISPQRPDNYRDCSSTSKRPGHKSLRAQYASPHTSSPVGSLLFCLQRVQRTSWNVSVWLSAEPLAR